MKKKRMISVIAGCVCAAICMTFAGASAANETAGLEHFTSSKRSAPTFSDVRTSDWFASYVKSVSSKGLMVGNSATTFNPKGNVTLAETVTVASRLHCIYYTGSGSFRQSGVWYQVYLDYAKAAGIYFPEDAVYTRQATRAEFAQIVASAFPAEALAEINHLPDTAVPDVSIRASYGEAVYTLYRAGILTGNDAEGTFAPYSNISRSEVAAIISRMVEPDARILMEPEEDKLQKEEKEQEREPEKEREEEQEEEQEKPEKPVLTEPTFCVETVEAKAGQKQVAVTVSVKNNPGIAALALNLSYDNGISLTEIEYNDRLPGETMLPQTMKNPVKLLWLNPFEDVYEDFVLATVYFDVSDGASEGDHQISVTYNPDDVFELSEDNVYFEIAQGSIRVTK